MNEAISGYRPISNGINLENPTKNCPVELQKITDELFAKIGQIGNVCGKSKETYKKFAAFKEYLSLPDSNYLAQYYLGSSSLSSEETVKFLKLSADQGYCRAQANLACIYSCGFINGENIRPNKHESFKYYKLAADQGDGYSQWNVAIYYESGVGTEKNQEKAFYYCKLANDHEFVRDEAILLLYKYYKYGIGTEINEEEAIKYRDLLEHTQEEIDEIFDMKRKF